MKITGKTVDGVHEALRQQIESTAGRKMRSPKDFDVLSEAVFATTHVHVSPYTLRRYWGYDTKVNTRVTTLDILCQYVGAKNWEAFCQQVSQESESGFISEGVLVARTLHPGDLVELKWHPDRRMVACYEGDDQFVITESENGKLEVGRTFRCPLFVANQPLVLLDLKHGNETGNYQCGTIHGIQFKVIGRTSQSRQ